MVGYKDSEQVDELLELLDSHDLEERLTAIQFLGEIGDERALAALRERLQLISNEHYALIVAVGMLKRELGVLQ